MNKPRQSESIWPAVQWAVLLPPLVVAVVTAAAFGVRALTRGAAPAGGSQAKAVSPSQASAGSETAAQQLRPVDPADAIRRGGASGQPLASHPAAAQHDRETAARGSFVSAGSDAADRSRVSPPPITAEAAPVVRAPEADAFLQPPTQAPVRDVYAAARGPVVVVAENAAEATDATSVAPPTQANGDNGQSSDPLAAEPAVSAAERYRSQLVAFYNIGFSSTNAANRHVGRGLSQAGWAGFVANTVRPDLAIGFRRVQLHNPFGDDGDFPMELDQFQRSQEAGLDWLTEGFVEAWKPVIRGDYTDGEPVDVLAYMGTARLEPFESLEEAGDWDAWLARAQEAVRPPIEAGMSLGFDSFSLAEAGSYSHRFTEVLRERGVKFYIETWPRRVTPHWQHTNVVVAESWFQRNSTRDNVFSRSELTGEVVRLLAQPLEVEEGQNNLRALRDRVVDALADGYSASVHPDRLREQVRSLDEVFEAADSRRKIVDVGAFD